MSGDPTRELRAERTTTATPSQVWAVLGDVGRMGEWSPETRAMLPLKTRGLRPGQWYLGVNRRGAAVWPTRSIVLTVEPARRLVWDTPSSGARWVWELEPVDGGTRVVHRRPIASAPPWSARLFARVFLGGLDGHADELEDGMATSVERVCRAAEG